ncbi:hypothetical protein [Paraburkholderia domus]|uniref:hypothetical protein n=1 Tax=Paraburkholderia domus TaxID=2793075 RepID=UPI001B088072|nr:hypothetical protein [Paraburkholderia domus]CAE6768316.1 hypothetical protein R75483_03889 [Paraburkholderia domus]
MSIRRKLIGAYLGIAVLFGLYGSMFGLYSYRGFMYNLGRGLVWPTILFPAVGHLIGGLIIVGFVLFLIFFVRSPD